MMNERILELIHGEIDGINSESHTQQLHTIISSDPQAKKYFDEQRRISSILSGVQESEPPASLKRNVMNHISNEYRNIQPIRRHAESDAGWLHWTSTVRIAVGMAAGILLMAIISYSPDHSINPSDVHGTLMSLSRNGEQSTTLQQSSVSATISWFTRDQDVIFVVSTNGSEEATMRISCPGDGSMIQTVTRDRAGADEVVFGNQAIVIQHVTNNDYTIVIERADRQNAQIDFSLEVGGQPAATTVTVNWQ